MEEEFLHLKFRKQSASDESLLSAWWISNDFGTSVPDRSQDDVILTTLYVIYNRLGHLFRLLFQGSISQANVSYEKSALYRTLKDASCALL